MTSDDVEEIRARSKAANEGPWVTDWGEMAKKTVLRRLLKTEPLSPELQKTIGEEEIGERVDLDGPDVIDVGCVMEDDGGEDRDLSARTEARKGHLKERLADAKQKQASSEPKPIPPMPEGIKPVTPEDVARAEKEVREKRAAAEGPPADLPPVPEFPDDPKDGQWINFKGNIYRYSFADSAWRPHQKQQSAPAQSSPAVDNPAPPTDEKQPGTLFGGGDELPVEDEPYHDPEEARPRRRR
jgi:hypothetical protein